MTLYEIDSALEAALEKAFDPETGELIDEAAFEQTEALQLARDAKIENVALWIKNLNSDAEALKAEKEAFAAREKAAKNKAESLKRWLAFALAGEKFKTDRVAISYRTSEAVEIDDPANAYELMTINDAFVKLPAPEINKTAIKAALKEGAELPGVHLVQRSNIQIK